LALVERKPGEHEFAGTEHVAARAVKEVAMYITDVVWGGYVIWVAAVAVFMIVFTVKIRQKGG
jgi:hypothetical protein